MKRAVPFLAIAWCSAYAVLGIGWALGGPGFPFGPAGDPKGTDMASWFSGATPGPTGAAFALVCGVALVALVALVSGVRGRATTPTAVVLIVIGTALLLFVPDVRLLQNMAYGIRGYFGLVDWPVISQALCALGGALVAASGLGMLRRRARADDPGARRRWATIGWWATAVAVISPLPYAIQRALWNLGVPLWVDDEFVRGLAADLAAKDVHPVVAYSLSTSAVGGALLTLGLSMRWGEVLPRWVPFAGGRRVPVWLAVGPATAVAIAVTVAGLAMYRWLLGGATLTGEGVAGLLFLPWGLALGLAALAYFQRRRATRLDLAT